MIELIVKSYFDILLAVAASCFSLLCVGMYIIFKRNVAKPVLATNEPQMDADIHSIAGEDLFSTQLDLARAFIESGKKQFAKKILENILEGGNSEQKHEARLLLGEQCE